ncbi:iron-containing alcohol dehydrogenase [Vallitalea guaymasensis]|uniref:iron-containing alcohol dehydrogenase n=1 Tax=Vallitalea guaymasensis TaxID=1185412 RepID=UPI000DE3746B|nr:iron-containing alcohol dehydrogenase [Vallitalea guaymasensis]
MKNFVFNTHTKVYFGKEKIVDLSKEVTNYGTNVLLVYGQGAIKKNGIYSEVVEVLNKCNVVEFGGITPNPRIKMVREGIKIARDNKIDVVLAVGGASVIDCAKIIAAGYYYEDDPWDLVICPGEIKIVLPIITVLTSFGTGSEMNGSAVINNEEEEEKIGTYSPLLQPEVSILDPVYTYSLSADLTAAGVVDTMSHAMESYFSKDKDTFVQDRIAEGIIKTCIKYGPIAIKENDNYEARANLMWAGALGLNGLTGAGKTSAWSCHPMEHELSAFYDITHGAGMAVLMTNWMRYILNDKTVDKFVEYAENVWHIFNEDDKYKKAEKAIEMTRKFFDECNMPVTLGELGIDDEKFESMAVNAVSNGLLTFAYVPLKKEDVINIYKMCL